MMRRIHILAFIRLLSATLPVGAASVIPAAATNYYFTTPLRPAHIRGLVMGSPPAYYIPRSEDFDWLNEAYHERVALSSRGSYDFGSSDILVPEFGKWNLSETNRFDRWVTAVDAAGVTNVVVGYNLVTNTPTSDGSPGQYWDGPVIGRPVSWSGGIKPGTSSRAFYNPVCDPYAFLDPDVQLVKQSRTYDLESFTNVYTVASCTNAVTNSFSTIEMPMTNGTVSVHTNRWEAQRTIPVTVACTNVMTLYAIDYCHVGGGPFPGYTNAPPLATPLCHVPTVLSNDYAALRGTLRLADPDPWITNAPPADIVGNYYFTERNTVSGTYTNHNDTGYHFTYWIRGSKERIWAEIPGTNVYERIWYTISEEEFTVPQTRDITVRTRFPSKVVTTGGVARVTLEAAFADVWFAYFQHQAGDPVPEDGDAGVDVQEMYMSKNVVLRLNVSTPLDHTGEHSCVRLTLDSKNLLNSAASAIQGVPTPPQNAATFSPPEWHECSWSMHLDGIVLIYSLHPTSKFTDW